MAEDGARPEIKLASVFYEGKPLVIPGYQLHISIQVTQILHKMQKMIPHLFEKFPQKFHDEKGLKLQEVLDVVELYNKVAKPHANTWSGSYNEGILGEWGNPKCSDAVAEDIVMWAYGMGIKRPLDLNNHYKSFSAETYGETNLKQMAKICDEINIGKKDVFVDLGCGVGQLVCFVAAYKQCKKSVGIEKSDLPYECATQVTGYFKKLMSHFGKKHGKFEISHGDMLDEKYRKLICEEATVIFINNLMFDEKLMFQLKLILQDLKPGTKVITTKPVCDIRRTDLSDRSLGDITALSETSVLTSLVGGVSWTQTAVPFYLTIMRQDKLEKYFEQKKTSEETERKPKRRREKEESSGEKRKKTKRRRQESEDSEDSEDVTMSSTASLDSKTLEVSEVIVKDSEAPEGVEKAPEVPPPLQKRETLVSILEAQFSPQKASDDIVKDSEDVETPDSSISDVRKDSGAPNSIKMTAEDVEKAIARIQMRSTTPEASETIVKDSEDVETSEAPNSIRMTPEYAPECPPPLQKRVTLASLLEAQFSPQKSLESSKIDLESRILEIQMRSDAPDDVMTWLQTPESSILILDDEKMNPETPEDVKILKSIDFDVNMETMTSDDVTNVLKSLEDSEDVKTSEVVVKDSEVQEIDVNMDSEAPEVDVKDSEASEDVKTSEVVVVKDSKAPEVDVKDSESPVLNVVKMNSEAPEVDVKDSESPVLNVVNMDSKAPEVVDVKVISMTSDDMILKTSEIQEAPHDVTMDSEVQKIDVNMDSEAPEVDVTAPESPVFNVKMDSEIQEIDVKMNSESPVFNAKMDSEASGGEKIIQKDSEAPEVDVKAPESPVLNVVNMDSEAPESPIPNVKAPDDVTMVLRTSEIQDPEDVTAIPKTPRHQTIIEPPIDTEPSPLAPPPSSMVTRMISPIMSFARNYFFPVRLLPTRRESAESTLPNIQEDATSSSTKKN